MATTKERKNILNSVLWEACSYLRRYIRRKVVPGIHAFGAGKVSATDASGSEDIASCNRFLVSEASTSIPIGMSHFKLPSLATSLMTCFVNNSQDKTSDL